VSKPRAEANVGARWLPVGWVGLTVATASIAAVLAGGLAATALPVLLGATITRSGADAAGVACVGLALVATLLPLGHRGRPPRELPDVLRGVDRATVAVAGGWMALTLVGIGFRAAEAYGRPLGGLGSAELSTFALDLSAGRGLLLTAGCAAAVLVCAALRTRDRERVPPRLVLVVALLGTLMPALTGHAGTSSDHELAVITVALHVTAAALWVGGLGAVLVVAAPRPRLLDVVLPRFSTLAGGCLACVVVSGVLNAVLRVPSWEALVTTGYGWLVLAKSLCVVVLGGLGGLARRRLAAGRLPVLRWAGAEIALMAVTVGLAAALTQAA
jgi:putative copper resistance protein D